MIPVKHAASGSPAETSALERVQVTHWELKAIRKAVGMSQIQLAREAKISRFRIYLFEAGSIELRPDEIGAITKAVQPGIERAQQIISDFRSPSVATGDATLSARKPASVAAMSKNHRRLVLSLFAILLFASAPALATPPGGPIEPSVQASGQITSNTYGASVNLLTATSLYPNPTITGFSISTPANLAGCTTQQPQISFQSPSGVQLSLTTLTNGLSQWTNSSGLPHTLSLGDSVLAVLITPGDSGCTNELPITVTLTYLPGPPAMVPVSFNVSDIGGSPGTTVKARFTLVNCGSNTPIIGTLNLAQNVKDFTSNSAGLISGSLYPTDGVQCAGQQTAYYQLTYLVNGVPNQVTGRYLIQSGPGTFNPALVPLCQSGTYQEFCMLQQTPAGPIVIGPAGPPGPPGAGWNPPIDSGNLILASPADGSSGPMAPRAIVPLDVAPALVSPPPIGNTTPNSGTFTALTYQSVTGKEYLVSKYASIQDAINAAYGTGTVQGEVIDDRTSNYTGPGFYVPDTVIVRLAAVTYTFNSTVTYNNENNVVTAAIVLLPGAHLDGQGTSTNHGTILQPADSLNADLIATSTVGTGTGSGIQWWHWGEIGNLRIVGNGANQTAGDCLKIENLGETARVHDIELSACFLNNLEFVGYSATQSAVTNITSNRSVTGSGVAFTNLGGVGILNGISGDCNQVALINANFNAAGTLQITGLKAEAETSICPAGVQDPVILSSTTDRTVLGSISVNGGYAFGTSQVNFIKSVGPGSIQYLQHNFYLNGYTNILNDTVRTQVIATVSTTTKQPISYLSNGWVFGNQAFTFQSNTFMQGNPNGTPTEIFGLTSASGTLLADAGNGDGSSIVTGGIQIAGHNRTTFGQSPEVMARWGYRFTGTGSDTTKWDLVPAWNVGDTTEKNIGNPLTVCQKSGSASCRWSNVYAVNIDTTTFTLNGSPVSIPVASLSTPNMDSGSGAAGSSDNYARADHVHPSDTTRVPTSQTVNGHPLSSPVTVTATEVGAPHLVSGTMSGATSSIVGAGSMVAIYSKTIPAGTFSVGTGIHCYARMHHTGSATVTMQWALGSNVQSYPTTFSGSTYEVLADIEILTPSSMGSELVTLPFTFFGGTTESPQAVTWSDNLANADTIAISFSVASTDHMTGDAFYCQTIQ